MPAKAWYAVHVAKTPMRYRVQLCRLWEAWRGAVAVTLLLRGGYDDASMEWA